MPELEAPWPTAAGVETRLPVPVEFVVLMYNGWPAAFIVNVKLSFTFRLICALFPLTAPFLSVPDNVYAPEPALPTVIV